MDHCAKRGFEIKSLVKTLRLLKLFSPQRREWTAEDMAGALGFHKSSVQRILATLEQEGFLSRTRQRRSEYRLGPEILFLGNLAEMGLELRTAARPAMEALVRRVAETCYLCVADQDQCLYIECVECSQPIRIINQVGQRNPLHCTGVGKALMSGMSDAEIERLIAVHGLKAYTRNSITDPAALRRELASIRESGIALDNEELNPGVKCVAAPIRNFSGAVVASISLSGPTQRFTPAAMRRFEKEVRSAAAEISRSLGFIPAPVQTERGSQPAEDQPPPSRISA
jgi:DNA-binding IclR family transcriptional regulator